ncbi:hypothetical protein CYMTET_51736 [Cymbomonas tetramitiformis]|uniref:RNA 3'-terminal-phosphate cyclase (ATP) n=1 Tax=Cymbomonas tetramitiformis TaxID=36881 RepID=A0AAE0ERH9_9CHLO|nr:hypothetical protein CYMTET_51736 [Cymbomonas tetramitiformis]
MDEETDHGYNHVGGCLEIDGSSGEGGGQILRNSTALAAITGGSVRITKIRANRPKGGGLRPQHLCGIELIRDLCCGDLTGGSIGSTEVTLSPGDGRLKTATANTGTAGSCTLLAQTAVPLLLMTPGRSSIELIGGTDVPFSPPADYLRHVLRPLLVELLNVKIAIEMPRRGFMPRGGGCIQIAVEGLEAEQQLPAFSLKERGELKSIEIRAFYAGRLSREVAERMIRGADERIQAALGQECGKLLADAQIDEVENSHADACGILVVAHTTTGCRLGGSALGEKKLRAEVVGANAALEMLRILDSGACVDEHMQVSNTRPNP